MHSVAFLTSELTCTDRGNLARENAMELNEKLQELRKQKGLTQEQLAERLYVSRTAISKWESGRGYPNIESLKAIARLFSVSLDELLSADEIVTIAEEEQKQTKTHLCDLVFGMLDLCMALLLFLPLFATRTEGTIQNASLLTIETSTHALKVAYISIVISLVLMGGLMLVLQNARASVWVKRKRVISLALSVMAVMLFMLSLHPYAAAFAFALLTVKVLILIKRA